MIAALSASAKCFDAWGRLTGILPLAMKLYVVSTMVRRTSMMSTKGMTFMVSKGFRSILDLPFQHQYPDFPQERVVEHHGDERDDEPCRSRLQGEGESGHDPARVHGRILPHVVEGEHDP